MRKSANRELINVSMDSIKDLTAVDVLEGVKNTAIKIIRRNKM